LAGDSTVYYALPELDHDTLAFRPLSVAELATASLSPRPDNVLSAVSRNRRLMRQMAEEWVRRAPRDPIAYDSLATWAEVSGGVATVAGVREPALQVVEQALSFARDSTVRADLGVRHVRLLLKGRQFRAARVAAESLLAAGLTRRTPWVAGAAGVAALTGRFEPAVPALIHDPILGKVVSTRGASIDLPPQLAELNARLTARTALGIQDDSVQHLADAIDRIVPSYFTDSSAARTVRSGLLPRSLIFVYPAGEQYIVRYADPAAPFGLYRALSLGDSSSVRAAVSARLRNDNASEVGVSIEMTFLYAQLALAVHDTSAAVRLLDPILDAMPTLSPSLLIRVDQTGALVRALALRADIANDLGDRRRAHDYAAAVVELWQHADPELQGTVKRMRRLTETNSTR
jgi:hypothetical protein